MAHLRTAGHRGHGPERILVNARCTGQSDGTHEVRARQLSDGEMTCGNQPTHIRGIDRRRKVPMIRCSLVRQTSNLPPPGGEP